VGLEYVKEALLKDRSKAQYYVERFEESQKYAQVDPWQESINSGFTKEFEPIVLAPKEEF
jgi:nitrite reductase (NADH) large subunit